MTLQAFQPIAAIATTITGAKRLYRLIQHQNIRLWVPESLAEDPALQALSGDRQCYSGALRDHVAKLWASHRALVFCLATGAVVRLIAPLLKHKTADPAVVVVDEAGKFVISLCGGHQGGADQLTRLIALQMNATPVLTGAANALVLPGIDVLGAPFGWHRGSGNWTGVSAAIARGSHPKNAHQAIQVIQEAGSTLWQDHLPSDHPFHFGFSEDTADRPDQPPIARVWISPIQRRFNPDAAMPKVQWHPRVLWVGIGCERHTPKIVIEQAIQSILQAHHLAEGAIAGLATIDLKADEVGLVEFCRDRNLPLRCFPAAVLRLVDVPNPSTVVDAEVGTPSVSEAAALLASGEWGVGEQGSRGAGEQENTQPSTQNSEFSSTAAQNATQNLEPKPQASPAAAPDRPFLRVAKQIFRLEGQPGAVTVAIAQAAQEYTGRTGQLWLVGTGPGQLDQITPAAQMAIAQADVVIGYSLYVDLIQPLLRPGQIVEALPITQERQRAERAIALAQWGLTVAVISSGDCGIYGMAGLVLEQLCTHDWDGKTPAVQVFPGITALQSAASRVGAPLMHDFCAISLSDLLTPWDVIEKRLQAAAQADFVVALYNPKSQTRTRQIEAAQAIFLEHRDRTTPVALVRAAYRPDEQVTVTTLAECLSAPIDMLTTVLIGNQSSRTHANWIITPRGYLGFSNESLLNEKM